ncbi:translation initiation factor IF-2-like [Tachyglossus aculeatus]|uniref:translation initiation factor IF-2-like n=1 Tax=Tachyglossus aculeatus TaxID=9261 RepID=UPI0018F562C7|nr:translation initiation factor IF-2-like [Tachyglossus aculeatus]
MINSFPFISFKSGGPAPKAFPQTRSSVVEPATKTKTPTHPGGASAAAAAAQGRSAPVLGRKDPARPTSRAQATPGTRVVPSPRPARTSAPEPRAPRLPLATRARPSLPTATPQQAAGPPPKAVPGRRVVQAPGDPTPPARKKLSGGTLGRGASGSIRPLPFSHALSSSSDSSCYTPSTECIFPLPSRRTLSKGPDSSSPFRLHPL